VAAVAYIVWVIVMVNLGLWMRLRRAERRRGDR
jgi:hypothetical protein